MKRENNTGNLIIEFEVVFPDSLTKDTINKLSEIL
jgi:DnaJ-class molecular chaperone